MNKEAGMKVATVEQMREMDRRAVEDYALPETVLMENAGMAAFSVIQEEFGVRGLRFLVLCGLGNNGGDGFVTARKIHSNGGRVKIVICGDPAKYKGASADNLQRVVKASVEISAGPAADGWVEQGIRLMGAKDIEVEIRNEIESADVLVDALFGTGLTREVGGIYKTAVEAINESGKPVFSMDIPSGVDGNNGRVCGVAVNAHHTITFGLPKLGNLLYPGAFCGGKLWVTHISFPPELYEDEAINVSVVAPQHLPPRRMDGHKGSFGDVLFVAGAAGYLGAPCFSSMSFLKAGGGYSRLAAPGSVVPHLAGTAGEVVFLPQPETPEGTISLSSLDGLLDWCTKTDMVVAGPGLSLNEETQEVVRRLAAEAEVLLLLDGDALTAAAADPDIVRKRTAPTILTPHPGEMARLCGITVEDVKKDSLEILRRTCMDLKAHIVLKGAHSLIGLPSGRIYINVSGNSGMASAGSGDVLTGTIAAMYGLGLPPAEALMNGVFLHGMAGDLAACHRGLDGITARDIMEALPEAVEGFREDYENIVDSYYGALTVV